MPESTQYLAIPTPEDVAAAKAASRQLAPLLNSSVRVHVIGIDEDVELPALAVSVLVDMLTEMAKGNAIALDSLPAEMTRQQAAAFLSVSLSFLNEQMAEGLIPHQIIRDQPHFRLGDLLEYQRALQAKRSKALDDLAEQAQDLNMGY